MWRWIFLDVGNVLLDEDPLTYLVFRRHAETVRRVRPDVTFGDFLALREALASAGSRWPLYEAVSIYLDEGQCARVWDESAREVRGRYDEIAPLIPGAVAMVESLSRHCRLGLIANQGRECRERLDALGLLERFDVVAFSEEQGYAKPDLRLFERALSAAGERPGDCLMVGDRLDNDVAPAAALGLATAWIRWPDRAAKGWRPDDLEGQAYLASLERAARHTERLPSLVQPTLVCDESRQLARALAIDTRSSIGVRPLPPARPGPGRRPP
jgi:HAD superfamily hydrolase (TIGR01509 family)